MMLTKYIGLKDFGLNSILNSGNNTTSSSNVLSLALEKTKSNPPTNQTQKKISRPTHCPKDF